MIKTNWFAKAIYIMVALALVLGFTLMPSTPTEGAFGTYAGYTFGNDANGTAVWSTTPKHSGSYSAKLTAPAAADYARVKVPITSTPLSTFNAPSFWYRISGASAVGSTENIGNTWPMYVRSADTVGTGGYLSAYPIIYIKNNGTEHWIIGQPWAEAAAVDWTQWSNAQASKVHTEALWHMEDFSVNPNVGGQVPAGWGPLSYWKTYYSTFNVLDVRVGIGYFTGLTGQQAAFVDDLTINPTYDLQPMAIENSCYQTGQTVNFRVLNGNTAGTLACYVWSTTLTETNKITIAAPETGTGTGIFSGTFTLVNTTPGPGQLLVNSGDTIWVKYTGNWGLGSVDITDTAVVDNTAPTVALTSGAPNPFNTATFTVTATFSEPVTGFDATDITVGNGTKGTFTATSTTVYTQVITPTAQGAVTVDIAAGAAQDCAGNNSTAATQLSRIWDTVQPGVTLTSTAPNPFNTATFTVTATFTEPVTGFDGSDITVGNGTKGTFTATSTTVYTQVITPNAQGAVTVDIAAGGCQDAAGNTNTAATQLSRTWDTVQPGVTLTSTAVANGGTTTATPVPFTATFSEAVTGFVAGDITVTNAVTPVTNFAGGPTVYTFDVTPNGAGTTYAVTVGIAASMAQDAALNNNTVSTPNPFGFTFNVINPTCVLTSAAGDPTNAAIPVVATFSSAVTGFDATDITLSGAGGAGGTISGFTAVSGTVYNFNVNPAAQGLVNVNVAAGVCVDGASRPNLASNTLARTYDSVVPTVVITAPGTPGTPWQYTATFSENVVNFVLGDITGTNATIANLAGGAKVWTFNVTPNPLTNGTVVTVNIAAGVCNDAAGNLNAAAAPFVRTYNGANAIYLGTGWNLISYPLVPANNAIGTVLASISANVNAVWYYNPSVTPAVWQSWSPTLPSPTLTTIDDGKAYWLDMAAPGTLVVTGTIQPAPPALPRAYPVYVGWNMLGYKSAADPVAARTTTVYLGAVETPVQRMYKFDNFTNSYVTVNKGDAWNPGEGFWISTTTAGTVYP